jgi:tetratricopeptide (TPR) repeat protein
MTTATPDAGGDAVPAEVRNTFTGTAGTVVQLRDNYGNIYLSPPSPVPHLLPASTSVFVGRAEAMDSLDGLLASDCEVTAAIVGTAGVGKTSLAVHWGHRAQRHFPDGQFYADLGGYGPGPPVPPEQVLEGFLRALEVPAREIPWGLDAMAGLFRSLVHDRRVLVILDNASRSDQIRSLLPGAPRSVTIVTSRSRLPGLGARTGAQRISLDPMSGAEATALLRQVIGPRVDAEPAAAQDLARWCSSLPLTLRIVAERASLHPHARLRELADELAVEADRLDLLSVSDDETGEARVVFSWSYKLLRPADARFFRLLSLHRGPDIGVPAAAALASVSVARARRSLDDLASVHLVEETTQDRFRLHDLLRVYAAERAEQDEPPAERDASIRRLLAWYLYTARAGYLVLAPKRDHAPFDPPGQDCRPLSFADRAAALAWFGQEASNIGAATELAATAGEDATTWRLASTLRGYFDANRPWELWISANKTGLSAATRSGDLRGQAEALNNLGLAFTDLRQYEAAIDCYQQGLAVERAVGHRTGESIVLHNLARVYVRQRRYDEAIDHFMKSAEIDWEDGDWSASLTWSLIGETMRQVGRFDEAIEFLTRALSTQRDLNELWAMQATLAYLGEVYRDLGQLDLALDYHQQGVAVARETQERWSEATSLDKLASTLSDLGRPDEAREAWQGALEIFDGLGAPEAAEVRAKLAPGP